MTPAKEAFKLRGRPKGLMFHSDLGTQYTAYKFLHDELAEDIADYIHYYNTERPHKRCGYTAPNEFEEDYYKGKARTSL